MSISINPAPIAGLNGWRVSYVASTGSTNTDLLVYAAAGHDADKTWLIANQQLAGKGRRGRVWVSPPGNLHASLLLENPAPKDQIGFLPLVCAVAVQRAISAALGSNDHQVQIKWPNDILINGAKVCGMLLEADASNGKPTIVIGCGLNIVAHPDDTPYPAVHLQALRPKIDARIMFQHLAEAFAHTFKEWNRGFNSAAICDYWRAHAKGVGETITVNLANSSLEGICEGIDECGFLLLRDTSGRKHQISAGDVFFPR